MKSDFLIALTQLAAERHLPKEVVLQAIETALASAFKKDSLAAGHDISVKLNPNTGEINIYAIKTVVEQVKDERKEISLEQARRIKPNAAVGDTITLEAESRQASRIAAQTAKQIVLQRLREAERELVYEEFARRTDDIISGVVDQIEPGRVILDIGRATAVLPEEEQSISERYKKGQRLKVYVVEVRKTAKGPEIIVSRTHKNLLKRLFELEVPEVFNGVVEIKAIAREAGSRSKVAVAAHQEGVDPVGSCIGMRGNRIQNIVNELQNEKIDVVRWDKNPAVFIAHALSPAEVVHVELDQATNTAMVVVPDKHLSLAIGKEGQNARLAAKLTGWRLDIKSMSEWEAIRAQRQAAKVEERQAKAAPVQEAPRAEAPAPVAEEKPQPVAPQEVPVAKAPEVPASQPEEKAEEPVPQEVPALTPEEELAALSVGGTAEAEEEEEAEEAPAGVELDQEEIWKVPVTVPDTGRIRFAEEILDGPRSRAKEKKSRRGRDEGEGKARKPSRRGRYFEDDREE